MATSVTITWPLRQNLGHVPTWPRPSEADARGSAQLRQVQWPARLGLACGPGPGLLAFVELEHRLDPHSPRPVHSQER